MVSLQCISSSRDYDLKRCLSFDLYLYLSLPLNQKYDLLYREALFGEKALAFFHRTSLFAFLNLII